MPGIENPELKETVCIRVPKAFGIENLWKRNVPWGSVRRVVRTARAE